jgi:hypothetical protein
MPTDSTLHHYQSCYCKCDCQTTYCYYRCCGLFSNPSTSNIVAGESVTILSATLTDYYVLPSFRVSNLLKFVQPAYLLPRLEHTHQLSSCLDS